MILKQYYLGCLAHAAHSPTEPYAVLTGDTLFIGDVGRPDLRVLHPRHAYAFGRGRDQLVVRRGRRVLARHIARAR